MSKDDYNECVVDSELAAHNNARLDRKDTSAMKHDTKASKKIQEMLNDTKTFATQMSAATAKSKSFPDLHTIAGGDFANCI
jgi:hypothetical protein